MTYYIDSGIIMSWGEAVKNPNQPNIGFVENAELPEDFNGDNYLYINNEFVKNENNEDDL